MYMKSLNDLKAELKFELEKSANSNNLPEIFGVQVQHTQWNGLLTIVVQFKDNKGYAVAMLKCDENGVYKLLAPFDIKLDKGEEKKK